MSPNRSRRRQRVAVFTMLLAASTIGARAAGAQASVPVVTEVLALNRAGRWDDAAATAARRLADPAITAEERCMLYESAAYSLTRLGRAQDATAALDAFDLQCATTQIDPGFRAEAARLRGGAAARPGAPALPAAKLDLDNLPRAGSLSRERGTTTPPPALRSNTDGFWRVTVPGTARTQFWLTAHNDLCARTGADGCLVVRHGKILSEWYRTGGPDSLAAMSSTKSVTGLLTMMLLADGKLRDLNEPVCRFVNGWCDAPRRPVTIRHLLTMTAGLPSMTQDSAVGRSTDMNAFVAHLQPVVTPGTRWAYSNEGAQLLSPVLDRAAGEPIQQYASQRLFGPLGMRDTRFYVDARGHAATYANLFTTPRDFARLGLLVLAHGRWQGRQLIPAALIDSLVHPSQRLNPTYGMLWWRLRTGGSTGTGTVAYVTRGYLATNMYVFPDQDVIVVRMQNLPQLGDPHLSYEPAALPLFHALFRTWAPAHWH